jgi:hypothetical protein
VIGGLDPQALEQLRGVRLGRVAVLLADDRLQLGEAVPVLLGDLGLGEDVLLLLHGLPEDGVPHQHHVEDAVALVAELVLAQDSEALGALHSAAVRILVTGEDLHEGGLAGPVRAGQAVAPPWMEGDVDVLEQLLRPEGLADVLYRDHGGERFYPRSKDLARIPHGRRGRPAPRPT